MDRKEWTNRVKTADIVLFGAGNYARDFYRDFGKEYHIAGCVTNNPKEKIFEVDDVEVCPVVRVEEEIRQNRVDRYVICASASSKEMGEQLWQLGLIPGRDYCSSDLFRLIVSEKKIAVSYGVCYMRGIYECLRRSPSFSEKFEIFYSLSYMPRSACDDFLLKFIVSMCDLYLYNAFLSPENRRKHEELLRYLSKDTKRISIPVVSGNAYHPQAGQAGKWENPYGIISSKTRWGSFAGVDHNINRMLEAGVDTDTVLETIMDPRFYEPEWLNENYEKCMTGIQFSETVSDIRISDYLTDNRGKQRLFIDANHISNSVIVELSKRIAIRLGCDEDLPLDELNSMQLINTSEIPLYPSVIYGLQLDNYAGNQIYKMFTFKGPKQVNFEEYVRLYCDYCGNMMRYMNMGFFPGT